MKVKVELDKKVNIISIRKGSIVLDIFEAMELPPDSFIATIGGKPIPLNEQLDEGNLLKLVRVASGG